MTIIHTGNTDIMANCCFTCFQCFHINSFHLVTIGTALILHLKCRIHFVLCLTQVLVYNLHLHTFLVSDFSSVFLNMLN